MEILIECIELIVKIILILYSTYFLYISIRYLAKGSKKFQFFIYILIYLFYILPLMLHTIFPNFEYISFKAANPAMIDINSNMAYELFMLVFTRAIHRSTRSYKCNKYSFNQQEYNVAFIRVCTIIMLGAFFITFVTNGLTSRAVRYLSDSSEVVSQVNETLLGVGTLCYLLVLGCWRNISRLREILLTGLVLTFFWYIGKRYVIAETAIMIIYVFAITERIKGRRLIRILGITGMGLIVFFIIYGYKIKDNLGSGLEYFMIDLSRHYTLVYQIYCGFIGRPISLNRFDAIMGIIFIFVPREIWPGKPYPFVNQLTYSLVSGKTIPEMMNFGWATTCSIFSDLFDSFSYVGLFIGIIIIIHLIHRVNKTSNVHYKILLAFLTIRLLTVQLSAAVTRILICYVILKLCEIISRNRIEDENLKRKEGVD